MPTKLDENTTPEYCRAGYELLEAILRLSVTEIDQLNHYLSI